MTSPTWIWSDAAGADRNAFALFRRVIELPAWPDRAELHLFGDARWRLRVDGQVVAYGPGRFVPAFPEFDTIDLKPWLRPGTNVVVVEVWSPGATTFQTMPESSGGFIAWGTVAAGGAKVDLATAGDWRVRRAEAWDPAAPAFSFAQGPVEVLDAVRLPEAWYGSTDPAGWLPPVPRAGNLPWGALAPRSLPPFAHRQQRPARLVLGAALADAGVRVSCRRSLLSARGKAVHRFACALPIRSPVAQEIELGIFWGRNWLNGVELKPENDPVCGNRQRQRVALAAGWNLLYGEPHLLIDVWAWYAEVPPSAGLELAPLRYGPVLPEAELERQRGSVPATVADLERLPFAWDTATPAVCGAIPARDVAWDRAGRILARDADLVLPFTGDAAADPRGWVLLTDLGGEFLGHAVIDLDAPAGTVVDIAADERVRSDGLLGLYASSALTDGCDRIIHAGGRRTYELFHPRGGRYLQVTLRPGAPGPVTVHDLAVRDHQVAVVREGAFACADPVFDWTWEASYRTLQACVEDAFLDCPWRERGTYLGDSLVETATLAAFTRDLSVAERSLVLWAQGQLPDGQMQACVPSWHRRPHQDFTLIWVLLLHDLWRRTGDTRHAARWWHVVGGIFASPGWRSGSGGLWRLGDDTNAFIDWGMDKRGRKGDANLCINALRARALICAAELAEALGRGGEAARHRAEAEAVRQALCRLLWIPGDDRFASRLVDGLPATDDDALHGNVLMLAFGLAESQQVPGALGWLEGGLARNLERGVQGGEFAGQIEYYFMAYALEALYRHGRAAQAEAVMRSHWGLAMRHGAWTIWECFNRGVHGKGSLCHAWSTTPVRWFHERVLGVRPETDGDPTRLVVAPDSALPWAEGVVPHPRGVVRVSWRRSGDRLELTAQAPQGVRLRVAPGPSFAGLRLDARIS